jgi:hypothetical protein
VYNNVQSVSVVHHKRSTSTSQPAQQNHLPPSLQVRSPPNHRPPVSILLLPDPCTVIPFLIGQNLVRRHLIWREMAGQDGPTSHGEAQVTMRIDGVLQELLDVFTFHDDNVTMGQSRCSQGWCKPSRSGRPVGTTLSMQYMSGWAESSPQTTVTLQTMRLLRVIRSLQIQAP